VSPRTKNKTPKIPNVDVNLIILFKGILVSLIFIKLETRTELKNIATINRIQS